MIDYMGVCMDVCMVVRMGVRMGVRTGDRADVRRAIYRAVRADDYRAFLAYQCCVLVELLQSFCKASVELHAKLQ